MIFLPVEKVLVFLEKTSLPRSLVFIPIILFALEGKSQLHFGYSVQVSTKLGLSASPYDQSSVELAWLHGPEAGFRFKRFDIRVFNYVGESQKSAFDGPGESYSSYQQWGIHPQYTFLSTGSGLFNFDIGLPFSVLLEESHWKDHSSATRSNASGYDHARYHLVGFAPRGRFYFEPIQLGLEFGFNFNFLFPQYRTREVNSNTFTDRDYQQSEITYRPQSTSFYLGLAFHLVYKKDKARSGDTE